MKKILKWAGILIAIVLGAIIIYVGSYFVYINWEGKNTQEQNESLDLIKNLKNPPQPTGYTGKVSDDAPEIYQDQREPEKFTPSNNKNEDDD